MTAGMRPCLRRAAALRVPRPSRFCAASTTDSAMAAIGILRKQKGRTTGRIRPASPGAVRGEREDDISTVADGSKGAGRCFRRGWSGGGLEAVVALYQADAALAAADELDHLADRVHPAQLLLHPGQRVGQRQPLAEEDRVGPVD